MDWFSDDSALREGVHDRMVKNMPNIARDAGIQPEWIATKMEGRCSEAEIDWVRHFKRHASAHNAGLIYIGTPKNDPIEDRMALVAGTLTRNFILARVMTVNHVIEELQAGNRPMMSCLLIPNFFIPKMEGGHQPDWRVQILYDLLLDRYIAGLQTVLYATDVGQLAKEYGSAIHKHIEAHYQAVEF